MISAPITACAQEGSSFVSRHPYWRSLPLDTDEDSGKQGILTHTTDMENFHIAFADMNALETKQPSKPRFPLLRFLGAHSSSKRSSTSPFKQNDARSQSRPRSRSRARERAASGGSGDSVDRHATCDAVRRHMDAELEIHQRQQELRDLALHLHHSGANYGAPAPHPPYYRHRAVDPCSDRMAAAAIPRLRTGKYGMPRLPRGSLSEEKLPFLDCALASIALQRQAEEQAEVAQAIADADAAAADSASNNPQETQRRSGELGDTSEREDSDMEMLESFVGLDASRQPQEEQRRVRHTRGGSAYAPEHDNAEPESAKLDQSRSASRLGGLVQRFRPRTPSQCSRDSYASSIVSRRNQDSLEHGAEETTAAAGDAASHASSPETNITEPTCDDSRHTRSKLRKDGRSRDRRQRPVTATSAQQHGKRVPFGGFFRGSDQEQEQTHSQSQTRASSGPRRSHDSAPPLRPQVPRRESGHSRLGFRHLASKFVSRKDAGVRPSTASKRLSDDLETPLLLPQRERVDSVLAPAFAAPCMEGSASAQQLQMLPLHPGAADEDAGPAVPPKPPAYQRPGLPSRSTEPLLYRPQRRAGSRPTSPAAKAKRFSLLALNSLGGHAPQTAYIDECSADRERGHVDGQSVVSYSERQAA